MELKIGHPASERPQRIGQPRDRSSLAYQQPCPIGARIQRQSQGGAKLWFVLANLLLDVRQDTIESRFRFSRRIGPQQRRGIDFGMRGDEQLVLIREVPVCRGARNSGRLCDVVDRRGSACPEQVVHGRYQGGPGARFLVRPAGGFIRYWHAVMILQYHVTRVPRGGMMQVSPLTVAADSGERLWYDGGVITFKATGAQTGGAFLLFEAAMPAGKATPLHVHPEADETTYVLEGAIQAHIEGAQQSLGPGAVLMVPRGAVHAFRVVAGPARLLVVFTPASAISEAFFREAGEAVNGSAAPRADVAVDRLIAAAKRTGLKVLGPPPFAPLP
jgi:quercetin dioxygenase-like cupin family protein